MKKLILSGLALLLAIGGLVGYSYQNAMKVHADGAPFYLSDERPLEAPSLSANVDYKDLVTNEEKLFACESLMYQMMDSFNSQGEIAGSDWKTYEEYWETYKGIYQEKVQPLIAEYVKLRLEVRRTYLTDKEWSEASREEKDVILLDMLAQKDEARNTGTKAVYSGLDELKEITLYGLQATPTIDPIEDWTTYVEDDISGVITVTSNTTTYTNMMRASQSWLYHDFGVDHFGTVLDNPHLFAGMESAHSASAAAVILCHTLSNVTDPDYNEDPFITCFIGGSGTNAYMYIAIDEDATENNDLTSMGAPPTATWYFSFYRNAGGSYIQRYSDADRLNLQDTAAVEQGTYSYRYLHSCAPRGGADASTRSGELYDLDLQEAAGEADISSTPGGWAAGEEGTPYVSRIIYTNTTYWSNYSAPTFPLDAAECYFSLTNNSGGAVSVTINCTDWTGGGGWVLGVTPAADQVLMKAGFEGNIATNMTSLSPTAVSFISGLPDSASIGWELMLMSATSHSDGDQKECTVYLVATLD